MKKHKVLHKMLVLALPVLGLSFAQADTSKVFKPSPEPVFSTPRAKPNIHMVLDDSGSMKDKDIYSVVDGKKIARTDALNRTVTALLRKYRDKAYLGVSFLWDKNSAYGMVQLPLNDYSQLSDANKNFTSTIDAWYDIKNYDRWGRPNYILIPAKKVSSTEFEHKILYPITNRIQASGGGTPFYRSVYEAIKMFRGQPLNQSGGSNDGYMTVGSGKNTHFNYTKSLETPLRYRCQQNHLVVMTDGEPNLNSLYGIGQEDNVLYKNSSQLTYRAGWGEYRVDDQNVDGVDVGRYYTQNNNSTLATMLGEVAATVDLRSAYKPVIQYKNGKAYWTTKDVDDAGKDWIKDDFATPMPIFTHTVSLYVRPDSPVYTGLTKPLGPNKDKPGMNLGFAEGKGNAEDLLSAFDTIFASIIRSTSSTLSTNDRTNSDILEQIPSIKADGTVDMSTVGTIRYDTVYDFRPRIGAIRAMAPYISGYDASFKKSDDPNDKGKAIISTSKLWDTNETVKANQGRYVTYLGGEYAGINLSELKDDAVLKQFASIYKTANSGEVFDKNSIEWLTNFEKTTHPRSLRGRLNPLGSITNSDVVAVNKDILYIDIAKGKTAMPLRTELTNWLLYKARYQPKNFLIVGDNDGFINFINAQRGLTGRHKGGQRDTAYFPKMLVPRFDEIAKANTNATLVMESKTNLVDAKVFQPTNNGGEHLYATIGLTAQSGGGKGLVGYRVYADTADEVDDWISKNKPYGAPKETSIYHKVTPLFEITNEGPKNLRTEGFEDLGYTYSGFEFFNRIIERSNVFGGKTEIKGQAVAIFGNGFGSDSGKSVLYFIDAYTGKKLHEIVLDAHGLGASTPSIIVTPDMNGGQELKRIYVGDYAGSLYKIEFNSSDFTNSAKVTTLFKTPKTNYGQSAITVKPLVVKKGKTNLYNIYFGTGLAANYDLDRGKNSLVQHNIYAVTDDNSNKTLSINELAEGNMKYGSVFEDGKHNLELIKPSANKYGWYFPLTADSYSSGERTIQSPKYDSINDDIIFATWGIKERAKQDEDTGLDDPCIADKAFGKLISVDAVTGSGSSRIGFANKGSVVTASGGITGGGITDSPEGNTMTKLSDLEKETQEEVIAIVGKESSSHITEDEKKKFVCSGDLVGSVECDELKPVSNKPVGTDPIRLSIQTLFSS